MRTYFNHGKALAIYIQEVPYVSYGELVCVDKDMWERMVFNLLYNAFKYTTIGGITITLNAQEGKAIKLLSGVVNLEGIM